MSTVRQKIIEAFGRIPHPDLSSIHPLGCCEEHEADFAWYRQHTWKEFEEELPSERFDPFEFPSLHPLAYHYFVPGILMATLHSIGSNLDSFHLWEQDWVNTLSPQKDRVEYFKSSYLLLFSPDQKAVIASHLELFNDWHAERHGYRDSDLEWAVRQLWRDET